MLLFDTSALIDLEAELCEKRVGPVRAFMGRHLGEDLACSTITIGELAVGSRESAARILTRRLRKIPVSEAIAYRAADLDRSLVGNGQRLGENDTWIAATALYYSATLVHIDADFLRVKGLKRAHLKS
jgi:predicted nucleic acid-binding protein